jgi:conjugative transfer signal peptidase TraF
MSANSPSGRDLPLIAWGDDLRRRKLARRKRRLQLAAIGAASLSTLLPAAWSPSPRLLWNASASVPVGLYWIGRSEDVRRGDLVAARMPRDAAQLAAERGYLPLGLPVVKYVSGIPGDRICGTRTSVTINGRVIAYRLFADRRGRPLPAWLGCVTLRPDQILLLNADVPDSFDGRYFGPTGRHLILGRAHALWLR